MVGFGSDGDPSWDSLPPLTWLGAVGALPDDEHKAAMIRPV